MERKNKFALAVFLIIIVVSIVVRLNERFNPPHPQVIIKGHSYPVLVARSYEEQFKGLGDRDSLGEYIGMYFDFYERSEYGIVMRGMRFPLDVVWLDGSEVVYIAENLPLQPGVSEEGLKSYVNKDRLANAVLELQAGKVAELGIKPGDTVVFCEDVGNCAE
jgi:uncharacterized membrane protein (UPF0127 family)